MNSLNGRKVTYARMHNVSFVEGVGQIPKTLTDRPSGANKAYDMTYFDGNVLLAINKKSVVIPATNFEILELEAEKK